MDRVEEGGGAMSYVYEQQRAELFTDEGQRMFLAVRDRVKRLLKEAGAVRSDAALCGVSGSSWTMHACLDRLVELGEIREVTGPNVLGQRRIFVTAEQLR